MQNKFADKCPRNLLLPPPIRTDAIEIDKENYKCVLSWLINAAKKQGIKIIVRGGGSGVCGALTPKDPTNTIVVDMAGLNDIWEINIIENFVVCGAGIMGLELEKTLNALNYTLGHSPASLAISTPGGWIATRSSGQFSSRYGNIENLVLGMEVFTGNGKILWVEEKENLNNFFRMEGTNGIITKVKLKIFPRLENKKFLAFSFPNIKTAIYAMEKLSELRVNFEKDETFLGSLRVYDALDFKIISKPHKKEKGKEKSNFFKIFFEKLMLIFPTVINFLTKFLKKPVMILFLESDNKTNLEKVVLEVKNICFEGGGKEEKKEWSENWYQQRYKLNYEKLEKRIKEGILVDTFDCAASFETLPILYQKIKESMANLAIIGAHFGVDRDTPYIYFTFATFKPAKNKIKLYEEIWQKLLETCQENGGLTTHHHGIGLLKAGPQNSLVPFAYGSDWLKKAQEAKKKFDPDNIFNSNNII